MAKNSECILVFWGKSFDEAAATLFVTELRQAGLRVKVVGLDGRTPQGEHGLALVPDWTVSDAQSQSANVTSIILPCNPNLWQRIIDDPRVAEFLRTTYTNGTNLIVKEPATDSTPEQKSFDSVMNPKQVTTYPLTDRLVPFIRKFVSSILSTSNRSQSISQTASASPAA